MSATKSLRRLARKVAKNPRILAEYLETAADGVENVQRSGAEVFATLSELARAGRRAAGAARRLGDVLRDAGIETVKPIKVEVLRTAPPRRK